jgi:CTP:molybdopterin cytidylyltransferase MocA
MFDRTSILLLASGLSSRFSEGDKLMADLHGRPVLSHATNILLAEPNIRRFAVAGANQEARKACLEARGYAIVTNPIPEDGQGRSLAIGMAHIRNTTDSDKVLILLGDMPFVTDAHVTSLAATLALGASAVMSEVNGVLSPPAMFRRTAFDCLASLVGDRGARSVFDRLPGTRGVAADAAVLVDIDDRFDLKRAEERMHG